MLLMPFHFPELHSLISLIVFSFHFSEFFPPFFLFLPLCLLFRPFTLFLFLDCSSFFLVPFFHPLPMYFPYFLFLMTC